MPKQLEKNEQTKLRLRKWLIDRGFKEYRSWDGVHFYKEDCRIIFMKLAARVEGRLRQPVIVRFPTPTGWKEKTVSWKRVLTSYYKDIKFTEDNEVNGLGIDTLPGLYYLVYGSQKGQLDARRIENRKAPKRKSRTLDTRDTR